MARQRDFKAEYARRTQRAKQRGFKSYGQERKYRHVQKQLKDEFPNLTDITDMLPSPEERYKAKRLDMLRGKGASKEDVEALYGMSEDASFWKLYRSMYDKTVIG